MNPEKLPSIPRVKIKTDDFILTEEELGSSEESGKDWDELEAEARKGNIYSYGKCSKSYLLNLKAPPIICSR